MRLKILELKGFKSFADKTVINFSEDVIGIVGSNGCGKSNIVDAIRWVLGEQKTSALRSDSMTNVIFNGSKQKPAANMAEVTLVFENTKGVLPIEYTEVAIKRVLYKDATGEYYLNNTKCRLKDIQNLLADTGMSADSYAIISLNMVDDLLQDKDNARLGLFEQAAGISKYKLRKKETLSKLKSTEEDLARVDDLLSEINKNLESLEKQAARTKKYIELKQSYKQTALELFRLQTETLTAQIGNLEQKISAERQSLAGLDQRAQVLETQIGTEKSKYTQEETQLAEASRQLNSTVGKIKGKENEAKMLTQKIHFVQDNKQKTEQRIAQSKQKTEQLAHRLSQFQTQTGSEQQILAVLQTQTAEAAQLLEQTRSEHTTLKTEMDVFVRKNTSLQAQIFELEKQTAVFQSRIDQANQQIRQAEQQIHQKNADQTTLETQTQQLETETTRLGEQIQTNRQLLETQRQEIETCGAGIETSREQVAQLNRSYDAKQHEHRLLKSLVESLEGFSESVKFLNKDKSWGEQVPLFSDIIYCQPAYRTAVENYLDAYLSYYIVEDMPQAMRAIHLLEQHNKGKANFFVLDYFNQSEKNTQQQPAPAHNLITALSVVETDSKYQPLIAQLLENVVIVGTEKEIPTHTEGLIFITQDGKFAQKAYHLRGGSVGAFEGKKIGRKKNLELLEQELLTLAEQVQTHKSKLAEQQTRLAQLKSVDYQKEINRLEQSFNQKQHQFISIRSRLEGANAQILELKTGIEQQQQKILQIKTEMSEKQDENARIKTEMSQMQAQLSEKESGFKQIVNVLNQLSNDYNQKNIETIRQQSKIGALQKESEYVQTENARVQQEIRTDEQTITQYTNDLFKTEKDLATIQIETQELYEDKMEFQQVLERLEKSYHKLRGSISQVEDEIRQNNRQYQQSMQLVGQLESQSNQFKLKLSAIEERAKVEFEILLEEVLKIPLESIQSDPLTLEDTVAKLRTRLNNYGAVNYMAVEAYEEMRTRYDFIDTQRKDLVEARDTLMKTLMEIETVATSLFMTAFVSVRTHFISVFRSLFDEDDTCDLVLTDTQNPLDAKIEIIAKPKGKKPLSINQLSGGEKTLTATAILFALYLLKPAPFCVFDEVDAPLDDANIAKFNNIVRDFSANSQFIVVTHNKKTMETVNIMYGVTMVQSVSRVVPVDFRAYAP